MNIVKKIEDGAERVGEGIGHVFVAVTEVDKVYEAMTPEAKTAMVKTFQDLLAFIAACSVAGVSRGTSLPLDGAVFATAEQLYSDALQDIDSAKKVFAALGVGLPAPALPKAA